MYIVELTKVRKVLRKIPSYIVVKLQKWAEDVERFGLPEILKLPGYHDEPLIGKRKKQRSIRLSRDYRAIYEERKDGTIIIVEVMEVTKHDYRTR